MVILSKCSDSKQNLPKNENPFLDFSGEKEKKEILRLIARERISAEDETEKAALYEIPKGADITSSEMLKMVRTALDCSDLKSLGLSDEEINFFVKEYGGVKSDEVFLFLKKNLEVLVKDRNFSHTFGLESERKWSNGDDRDFKYYFAVRDTEKKAPGMREGL